MNFYLRQSWQDPRLQFIGNSLSPATDVIKLEDKVLDKMWVPDVFFRNEKESHYHHVTTRNRFMKLNITGYVWYVTK